MYKKKMTFKDYDGEEREVNLYFNIDAAEMSDMQTSVSGGYKAMIDRMIDSQDANTLTKVIKDLIQVSYGVKEDSGRFGGVFTKKPEYLEEFVHSPVYSDFYMMLLTDQEELAKFVNNVVSSNLTEKVEKLKKENPAVAEKISKLPSET